MKNTIILKKNYEFKNVLNKGKFFKGKQISIIILKTNYANNYLGIAISKKAANSVYRNKIKRLIRENYRLLEKNIISGNSFVILWNKKIEGKAASYNIIKEDMINILKNAKLLKEF